ncbi:MAG TPA: NAD(P)H-dependent oxidoreductase [Symbiobacteriaceae bacterium]|nr:NAD(P)H-dependent oxidoreductase [Symbiobacteriaceae bacterium]
MAELKVKRLLLLNGSPRKQGTSSSFARTITALAAEAGCATEIEHAYDYYDGRRSLGALRELIAGADLIGVVAPLYFDTLPGAVVWLFEQLFREMRTELEGKALFAVGQGAYPFAALMQPLIGSCRCFAEATGMQWLGGLGYGGGVLLDGARLEDIGAKGRRIIKAFRLALNDLLARRMISPEPQEQLLVRIPKFLFRPLTALLNYRVRSLARRHGVPDLGGQVYLQ